MRDLPAFTDFHAAASAVLEELHRRIGFDLWMVTRVAGEEWIILQVEDHGYGVKPGSVFRWADSFCHEMVQGHGPCVAPRVIDVPAYAGAALGKTVTIGSYVGVPLRRSDGSLFGTICAIHPAAQPDQIAQEQSLVELMGRLLATVLNAELKTVDGTRREERLKAQAHRDPVTELYDLGAWKQLLMAEDDRCGRYGNPACVASIELTDVAPRYEAGDAAGAETLLRRSAGALGGVVRGIDVLARVDENRFAVLGVECDWIGAKALVRRLTEALAHERVNASIGVAHRAPPLTLEHAWRASEQQVARPESSDDAR